jgi:hypothetical protein
MSAAGGPGAGATAPTGAAPAQPTPMIPGVAPPHAGVPQPGDPALAAALAAAQSFFLGAMGHAGGVPGAFPPGPAPGLFAPPGAPGGPPRPGSAAAMFPPDHLNHQMRPGDGPASRGATPGVGGEIPGATYNRKDKR